MKDDHLAISGGLLQAPLNPLKTDVSRGPPGLSGGPGPLGPTIIRPLPYTIASCCGPCLTTVASYSRQSGLGTEIARPATMCDASVRSVNTLVTRTSTRDSVIFCRTRTRTRTINLKLEFIQLSFPSYFSFAKISFSLSPTIGKTTMEDSSFVEL